MAKIVELRLCIFREHELVLELRVAAILFVVYYSHLHKQVSLFGSWLNLWSYACAYSMSINSFEATPVHILRT